MTGSKFLPLFFSLLTAIVVLALFPSSARAISVSVVQPNGGECLTVGQAYTITITMSGDTNHFALYYKTDGTQPTPATGAGPNDLDDSVIRHPYDSTTFNWSPSSGHISETGRIWIEAHNVNHNSANVWDQSDANFSVRSSCATGSAAASSAEEKVIIQPPSGFDNPAEFLGAIPSFTSSRLQFKSPWDKGEYRVWFLEDKDGLLNAVSKQEIYVDKGQVIEFRLDGLEPDTLYGSRYRIRGFEFAKGFESVLSQVSTSFRTLSPVPPGQVDRIFVISGEDEALFSWINPVDADFLDLIMIRRFDRFAENSVDGTLVFRGNSPYFTDEGLTTGVKYYYSIFSIDKDNNSSLPVKVSLTPEKGLPHIPISPFEGKFISTSTAFRVSQPSSLASSTSAKLIWKNPNNINFLGVQIVRNPGSLPVNPYDGKIVFRGRAEVFEDDGLNPDTRYFYGLFPFNWENKFSTSTSLLSLKTLSVEEEYALTHKVSVAPTSAAATTSLISESTLKSGLPVLTGQELIENLKSKIKELEQKVIQLQIQLLQETVLELQKKISELRKETAKEQISILPQTQVVRIDADGFHPQKITIRLYDTVRWENSDKKPAWPASDLHPQHLIYPEFDSLKGIFINESYAFTFSKIGTWSYHDHLNAARLGTIIVE